MAARRRPKIRGFLAAELGWNVAEPNEEASEANLELRREGIYNFLQIPWNIEPLMWFGYLVCVDTFIHHVTLLPLRFMMAVFSVVRWRPLSPLQRQDLTKGVLILLVVYLLHKLDMSQAYHNVRNQSVMKLYVVFNVLEIFDKLCTSFGHDILESLYSSTRRTRRWRGGSLPDFFIALVYIILHTLVLFYQVVALNVAINSHNNVLLTLLISNNFTELKISVFKRVEVENLFQIACADACERFQISVYLTIVALQFLFVQKVEWSASEFLQTYAEPLLMVGLSEILIDWIKHAFVTKFNRITPNVYSKFARILCADTAQLPSAREPIGALATRMGLQPIPLLCLLVRVMGNDVWPALELRHPSGLLLCVLGWLVLMALKVLTGIVALGITREIALDGGPEDQAGRPFIMPGIGRYTLFGKSIMG